MKQIKRFRIRKSWCDQPEEHNLVYDCTGHNPATRRIYGVTHDTGLSIPPTETFDVEMIEAV